MTITIIKRLQLKRIKPYENNFDSIVIKNTIYALKNSALCD